MAHSNEAKHLEATAASQINSKSWQCGQSIIEGCESMWASEIACGLTYVSPTEAGDDPSDGDPSGDDSSWEDRSAEEEMRNSKRV